MVIRPGETRTPAETSGDAGGESDGLSQPSPRLRDRRHPVPSRRFLCCRNAPPASRTSRWYLPPEFDGRQHLLRAGAV